jgi:SAM domain (Sterile alpha motif)
MSCFLKASRLAPAAIKDPPVSFATLVGFAPNDLSGKIARPAGPEARVSRAQGGDAEDSAVARKARMSEYAQRFSENGISAAALPHLTDEDLKDIGVLLGHRRIIFAAISELGAAGPPTGPPETTVEPKAPKNHAQPLGQTVTPPDLSPVYVGTPIHPVRFAEGRR